MRLLAANNRAPQPHIVRAGRRAGWAGCRREQAKPRGKGPLQNRLAGKFARIKSAPEVAVNALAVQAAVHADVFNFIPVRIQPESSPPACWPAV